MQKKGEMLKASAALVGTLILFVALYYFSEENLLYGGLLGAIGVLMITVSVMMLRRN